MPIPPFKRKFNIGDHVRREGRAGFFSRLKKLGARKILSYVAVVLAAIFLAGTIAVIAVFAWVARDLPDPNNLTQRNVAQTTKIYDRTGETVLYEIHGAQKRTVVELADVAKHAIDATITAEDRDFYTHKGFDLRGMLRAVRNNLFRRNGKLQGGSTITQQFIKKSVLTDEQLYTRKVKELILSIEIERRFTKDQILKLYLNEIPYGSVAYGIESAAETFFGKTAKELSLSEAALLASLPRGPTYYSPYGNHRDDLVARQRYILDGMVEEGYITQEEADEAKSDDALARIKPKREPIIAPHFVFYVREQLAEEFGEQVVERGGLKVITTLDVDKQKIAEEAIEANRESIKKWEANTAALTAIDPATGEVLAMVGSADYFDDEINGKYNSVLGSLQPGSSIKPIVYAAAFEKGFTPTTVVEDVKTNFSTTPTPYEPGNYDGGQRGPVTLKEALAGSLNIPAVKVLYLTGLERFQEFSKRLGYTTFGDRSRYGLALVLGGAEVRMIEHVAAFSAFAKDGILHKTKSILKVEDGSGKILSDQREAVPGKRVMDAQIARQINDILSDNAARAYVFGENNYLTLGARPVAAKTGTTNDYKDAWAVGYTPSLVAGVWVGDSKGQKMKRGADGSKVAAPIWNEFMRKALEGTAIEGFPAPEPVVTGKPILDGQKNAQVMMKIDTVSGKLATEFTPPEFVEERGFGVPHSILFFVDKEDPRGPQPASPENDPQYANWERGVAAWAAEKGIVSSMPPSGTDDVHVPENLPQISFVNPTDGGLVTQRDLLVNVSATSRRGVVKVEYALDGEPIGSAWTYPHSAQLMIANRFQKGYHTLSAKATDDVGNSSTATITVNLTAEAGPLGIQWIAPWSFQTISTQEFPFTVKFSIGDPKSVRELLLTARDETGGAEEVIGAINDPALPNMAMQWSVAPRPGRYILQIEARLSSGDFRREEITVYVQ